MKRFLIYTAIGILLISVGVWLVFYQGFYLDWNPDAPVSAPFRTDGKTIQVLDADGKYQTVELRGVDMTANLPGEYVSDFAPDEEDYLRWMEQISDMGANLIRVYTILDDDFYNALYRYNTTHDTLLWLLQGIELSDQAKNSSYTAFDSRFMGELIQEGKAAVDVIHGRKLTYTNDPEGGGRYWKDISQWVLGYVIGHEWNADTIAYTDNSSYRESGYQGTYFSTSEDASQFETMLAQVMDTIVSYESGKYKTQRLIGFNSAPDIDFLEYDENYARQLGKYAQLDAEHILPQEKLQSGYFAAYRLFDFCDGFADCLTEEQTEELSALLANIDRESSYGGYLDLVGAYHTMPVVATGYGFSSARGPVAKDEPPLTEAEQGESLMRVWQDAVDAGWAGVTISTWQDSWERRTWNTAFATELSQSYLWHDLQTDGQNYGLMAFAPGKESVCVIDGNADEWKNDTPILKTKDMELYLRVDQEGLYLLIRGENVGANNPLYLPIDLNPNLGSYHCAEPTLSFNRKVDFLLCLNGTTNSRLLVHERQDALRENFNYEIGKENPFIEYPDDGTPYFVPIGMALRNDTLIDNPEFLTAEQVRQLRALGVWETGALRHGNGNPEAENYDSLADFCFGEDCVEIRIPWLLLNVADPTGMRIHKDYYTYYGVETQSIRTMYIGLGTGETKISLTGVDTWDWDWKLTWHERLKQSYYVVQSYWKG